MVDETPCPDCGTLNVLGFLYVNDDGKHMHTHYVCTYWESNKPNDEGRCGWHDWSVPIPEEFVPYLSEDGVTMVEGPVIEVPPRTIPEVKYSEMIAMAHAVDPALADLDVIARNPIQGEAMHKVIGHRAMDALQHVGWVDEEETFYPISLWAEGSIPPDSQRVFIIVDPKGPNGNQT